MKKGQYAKAMHVFHDRPRHYNEMIDDLSVKELDAMQKDFLQQERIFRDVMDSFERILDAYRQILDNLLSIKPRAQIIAEKKMCKEDITQSVRKSALTNDLSI